MAADLRPGRLLLLDHAELECRARRSALQGARPVRRPAGQCRRAVDPGAAAADRRRIAAGRGGRRLIARARRAQCGVWVLAPEAKLAELEAPPRVLRAPSPRTMVRSRGAMRCYSPR